MQLAELNKLFKNEIDLGQFKSKIHAEVTEYKKNKSKKGASSSIYLDENIKDFEISKEDLIFLCSLFLKKEIDKWELNYISEALIFVNYEKMVDGKIQIALDYLTDPEYEKLINDKLVNKIIQDLRQSSN